MTGPNQPKARFLFNIVKLSYLPQGMYDRSLHGYKGKQNKLMEEKECIESSFVHDLVFKCLDCQAMVIILRQEEQNAI